MSPASATLKNTTQNQRHAGDRFVSKVAYNIAGAAKAAGVTETTIALAIRNDLLPAYRIDNQAITLHEDLTKWVRTHERF